MTDGEKSGKPNVEITRCQGDRDSEYGPTMSHGDQIEPSETTALPDAVT